jgi:hypothetical protein
VAWPRIREPTVVLDVLSLRMHTCLLYVCCCLAAQHYTSPCFLCLSAESWEPQELGAPKVAGGKARVLRKQYRYRYRGRTQGDCSGRIFKSYRHSLFASFEFVPMPFSSSSLTNTEQHLSSRFVVWLRLPFSDSPTGHCLFRDIDALSVAASIAGPASLAGSVLSKTNSYGSNVIRSKKSIGAPRSLQDLATVETIGRQRVTKWPSRVISEQYDLAGLIRGQMPCCNREKEI